MFLKRKILAVAPVFLSVFAVSNVAQADKLKASQKFPAFSLKTIDGKAVSSASLKNRAFWITFFASG